jgi:hypothetical protein
VTKEEGEGDRHRTSEAGTILASSTSRTVLSVSVASHRSRYPGFPRAHISLPFACTRSSPPTPLNLLPTPLHSAASFPAPTRAPSHCPCPSHRAPSPCCRGLAALPSDAFACSFASFPRVRSVTCTILTWVPDLRPASCFYTSFCVLRFGPRLRVPNVLSSANLAPLHLLSFSFDLYASVSQSVRTITLSYDVLGLPCVEY